MPAAPILRARLDQVARDGHALPKTTPTERQQTLVNRPGSSDVIDFSFFSPVCSVGLLGLFEISSTDGTKVACASA